MSQALLPAGCHDATSAAELLGISKKSLLKKMRELGWLIVGTDAHNLPRHEYIRRGWLTTQERGYRLRGKTEIGKSYRVMLLTQTGFNVLKNEINNPARGSAATDAEQTANQKAPGAHQATRTAAAPPAIEKPFNRHAAEIERQKALQQMADWNLPIAAGRQ